jgi:hypothetical protein
MAAISKNAASESKETLMMRFKKRGTIVVLTFIFLAAGYWAFSTRHGIAAKVWHWRHGYAATVGNYRVPVPDGWNLVVDENGMLVLSDTVGGGIITMSSTSTSLHISTISQLQTWREFAEESLRKEGVPAQTHSFQISGDSGLCVAGDRLPYILAGVRGQPNSGTIAVECACVGTLSFEFVGRQADLTKFYGIVDEIQKVK